VGKANAQYIDTVCGGEQGARYYTGARAGSTFNWTVEDGVIDSTSADGSQIWVNWSFDDGTKRIAVVETTDDGCSGDTVYALVLVLPVGVVDIFGPDAVCRGEEVELVATGADAYLWSTGATTDAVRVRPDFDTAFSVIGYFGDCGTNTSLHDLRVQYRPKADFDYLPEQPIVNTPIQFQYTGTNNVDNWYWTFKELRLPITTSEFINPEYTVQRAGILGVHLLVSNEFGCTDSITKYIPVEAGIRVFTPSAFTPNDDGFNNILIPHYEYVKSVEFVVFNRWGEILFRTNSLTEGWDGSYKGKQVPGGVYAYLVKATGYDDNLYTYKGTVTVLR
jgi:gliding motility-associated-like protein